MPERFVVTPRQMGMRVARGSKILIVGRLRFAMLFYAFLFFVVAGVAALAGFNELAPDLAAIARLVCYGFLACGFATLIFGLPRR